MSNDGTHVLRSTDYQALEAAGGFPFRRELSLEPLVRFWTRSADGASVKSALARMVGEEVRQAPELLGTIADARVLERHRDLLDILMSAVFPPASWEQSYGAAMVPFELRGVYATPPMRQVLLADDGHLRGRVNLDARMLAGLRRAYAYQIILERVYGVHLEGEYPLILTVTCPETGLDRHFRLLFDGQFVDVDVQGPVPPLTDEIRRRLRTSVMDAAGLDAVLPPDRFVFRGVTVVRAIEVTDEEVLSGLKRDLIDRESIVSEARFLGLQARLRTLFRRPELRFGLAALDGSRVLVLNYGVHMEHACIFADSRHLCTDDFRGTVFERAVKSGQPVVIDDLAAHTPRTCIEDQILESGVHTLVVAPLHYQDEVIGTIELGLPQPGAFDALQMPKLQEVLPLFAMAVQRSMEELNARIQTQIKERFTAIHPVVEWRFRKAVLDSLERQGGAAGTELEPIVFRNVYPLYALSDIRGSSVQRGRAIQGDLQTQLGLARAVVAAAYQARRLPALDQLLYRIDAHARLIGDGLDSGEEASIVTFLRGEVERLLDHLADFGPEVRAAIEAYRGALDPRLGVVYEQRRLFETSVTRLTEAISAYLDLEEQAAQSMFPHYFERQKTDGVDHQIYVGAALLEDGRFDPIYLRSLRLWQLMVVCGTAARAEKLAGELPLPLETTHLVLVQHAPLSIRFRFDEKRFDVDGAYDMRYEIVKKRIDKALVKGSTERVTQPSRIAIVYGHPDEAAEYRGHLAYLHHLGYVGAEVEDLELEDLQGVHGLRALRVAVTLRETPDARPLAAESLRAAAR